MIPTIIGVYLCSCCLCFFLTCRSWNNEFGWGERTKPIPRKDYFSCVGVSLCGPFGILAILLIEGRFCFMSKKRSLELYDAKHLEKYGYYIGRDIAKDDGRLPEYNSTD